MSLALTALRLQAVEALNSHPAIAAICEGRVYDSRIGDFDHREPVPVIVVTTEELVGEGWSANNGGAPFRDECDLVLEIAMNAVAEDEDGTPGVIAPATDRELEATLNLLTDAAETILTLGRPHPLGRPTPAGRLLLDAVTRRIVRRSVSRFTTDQTGEKLAIHLLTLRVEIKGEDQRDAREALSGPFAALPGPLRAVCEAMPEGSSGGEVCRMLVEVLTVPANRTLARAAFDPALAVTARPNTIPLAAEFATPEDP